MIAATLLMLANEIDCIARKNIFKGTQHPSMFQHSKIISPNSRKNPSNVSNNIILYSSQYADPTYTEHAYPRNKLVFAYLQENPRLFQPFSNRTLPENQISFANSTAVQAPSFPNNQYTHRQPNEIMVIQPLSPPTVWPNFIQNHQNHNPTHSQTISMPGTHIPMSLSPKHNKTQNKISLATSDLFLMFNCKKTTIQTLVSTLLRN